MKPKHGNWNYCQLEITTNTMIEIYIDNKFIESFQAIYNTTNKTHQNFVNFIKLIENPIINTNISKLEFNNIVKNTELRLISFWDMLLEYSHKINFDVSEINLLDKKAVNEGTIFKMFFLKLNSADCLKLSNKHGFAFFNIESFEEQWKPFYFDLDREDLELPVTNNENINPRFNSWEILEKFNFPLNTILISDPYILLDKELIRSNISQIIKKLLANVPSDISIEIIITTTDGPKELSNSAWEERWIALQEDLKNYLNHRANLKFALYRYPKNIPDHARFILTNYWFIKSGNSFNYFDQRGKLKNNIKDDISFKLSFLKTNRNLMKERLLDAKEYVSKSIDEPERGYLPEVKRCFQNKAFDKKFRLFYNI